MSQRKPIPFGTDQVAGGPKHWSTVTKASRERAEREGRLTHFYLLDEAASACLAEPDPKELKKKLYQLLIQTIDMIADTSLNGDSDDTTINSEIIATYQGVVENTLQWMRDRPARSKMADELIRRKIEEGSTFRVKKWMKQPSSRLAPSSRMVVVVE